jgi:hypothetical protein
LSAPAISVEGLRVVRGGNEVLHDLSFELEAGIVVVGSTLLALALAAATLRRRTA